MRYKSFTYQIDTQQPGKGAKVDFKGLWSRSDVDRMTRSALRELRKYKADLLRKDQKNDRTKSKSE